MINVELIMPILKDTIKCISSIVSRDRLKSDIDEFPYENLQIKQIIVRADAIESSNFYSEHLSHYVKEMAAKIDREAIESNANIIFVKPFSMTPHIHSNWEESNIVIRGCTGCEFADVIPLFEIYCSYLLKSRSTGEFLPGTHDIIKSDLKTKYIKCPAYPHEYCGVNGCQANCRH